ncbi:hypothetical protein RVR_5792 [Actinacidiphila reveromycinica]|uniref:Uncharacterized protein n=1 Tax=Actinacidiphila reveromycinica TaxID=659352 RepID=A0A7U3VPY4_9ACTN|nr:hypothetical protein [Streptomyces sp. SN-593]BBA99252.1 hypothetical protein RVR_5792 [Streptomyces sp. SN-593]
MTTNCELCGTELHSSTQRMLCEVCTASCGQQLAALPHLYRQLADELSPLGSNWPCGNGGHGTAVDAPMPLAEHPLVLRAGGGIVGVLEDWRAALHQDRGWAPPRLAPGVEPRVHAAVKALTANLPWIAERWPAAGEFAGEIRALYREVTSVVAPREYRGVRLGHCPAVYDGVLCGSVLWAAPGTAAVTCEWCSAEYPPRLWEWLRGVQAELEQAS